MVTAVSSNRSRISVRPITIAVDPSRRAGAIDSNLSWPDPTSSTSAVFGTSSHHIDQDEIVGEQPAQRIAVGIDKRLEEFSVRSERT
jgi:hypothetical protein